MVNKVSPQRRMQQEAPSHQPSAMHDSTNTRPVVTHVTTNTRLTVTHVTMGFKPTVSVDTDRITGVKTIYRK